MTARNAFVAIGVATPMLLSAPTSADVQLSAVAEPIDGLEDFVSMIVTVWVVLDGTDPANNWISGVGGLPGSEGHVHIDGGEFFAHEGNTHMSGRTAPFYDLIPVIPGLSADSFVTIGARSTGSPTVPLDNTGLVNIPIEGTGDWTSTDLTIFDGLWYLTSDDAQAHVGMADNGPNTVLVGQFSVAAGSGPHPRVAGELYIIGMNEGEAFQTLLAFEIPGPGTLAIVLSAPLIGRRRRRRS